MSNSEPIAPPLDDQQILACLEAAGCTGAPLLSVELGTFDPVNHPTAKARALVRAIAQALASHP